jgi:hypothetical protein
MAKGDRYEGESSAHPDPETGLTVHRLTSRREWNTQPTYHVNGFLDDGRIAFAAVDGGRQNIYAAGLAGGGIRQLTQGKGTCYVFQERAEGRGDGKGTDAFHMVAGYRTHRVYFVEGNELKSVDADTLEESVLHVLPDEWICGVVEISHDEKIVLLPLLPRACFDTDGGLAEFLRRCDRMHLTSTLLGVRTDGSGADVLWEDAGRFVGHAMFSPVSTRHILADRATDPDRPEVPLLWIIDVEDGKTWPLATRNPKTGHSSWLWDGSGALTHGVVPRGMEHEGAEYIQLLDFDGAERWIGFQGPPRYYGHCHSTPDGVIVTDAIFREDALTAVVPRGDSYARRTLCVHGTSWPGFGQLTHPHPHASPDGKWIVFGSYRNGRKDIYALRADEALRETGA